MINNAICVACGDPFGVLKPGSVSSSLAAAYFPGIPPFQHGGVGAIAGAMAFYLTKNHYFQSANKRTAAHAALVFLKLNGYDLDYPKSESVNGLADAILAATTGEMTIDELKVWFDTHKTAVSARRKK